MKPLSSILSSSLLLLSLLPANAGAAQFSNQFTQFELPPGWGCVLEVAEWVCQNQDEGKKKEAIIVLAAKLKGDQDSLDQYLSYLKATKTYTSISGKPMKSEPKYAKTVNLNGQPWVDALHMESEIPGFYTRYLATVKDDIGVLITYSIAKAKYQEYLPDFENMVRTLKVFRKQGGINTAPAGTNLMNPQIPQHVSDGTIFPGVAPVNPMGADDGARPAQPKKSDDFTLYIVIGAAAALLLILKKAKKK